jgi:protease I
MVPFVKAMTKLFAGEPLPEAPPIACSDPQRQEPPEVVIKAMKWIPRPSIRTAVGLLAALGAGIWATGRRAPSPARSDRRPEFAAATAGL